MTKPTITADYTLITVDARELKLLRELVQLRHGAPEWSMDNKERATLEALQPWSKHYGECQL